MREAIAFDLSEPRGLALPQLRRVVALPPNHACRNCTAGHLHRCQRKATDSPCRVL